MGKALNQRCFGFPGPAECCPSGLRLLHADALLGTCRLVWGLGFIVFRDLSVLYILSLGPYEYGVG